MWGKQGARPSSSWLARVLKTFRRWSVVFEQMSLPSLAWFCRAFYCASCAVFLDLESFKSSCTPAATQLFAWIAEWCQPSSSSLALLADSRSSFTMLTKFSPLRLLFDHHHSSKPVSTAQECRRTHQYLTATGACRSIHFFALVGYTGWKANVLGSRIRGPFCPWSRPLLTLTLFRFCLS